MAMRVQPSSAAIHAYKDEFGRVHLRPTPVTSQWAVEFRDIRCKFLEGKIVPLSPLATLALALILLDGIVSRDDHLAALCGTSTAYRFQGQAAVEWRKSDGRIDRRLLSPITTLFLSSTGSLPVEKAQALEAIDEAAAIIYPNATDPVARLYLRATAWASESLPGVLSTHVLGLAPMAASPRATLARLETGLACKDKTASSADKRLATEVVAAGLEIFHTSSINQGSAWAIAELEEACRYDKNLTAAENKRQMLWDCQKLLTRAEDADSISGLLLAWGADLIESGTPGKAKISPKTIHKYVRGGAKNLHAVLGCEDFLNWTATEFFTAYSRIIETSPSGSRKSTRSALASWHAFLHHWLGVPALGRRLHKGVPAGIPSTELIWPHEVDRIHQWLGAPRAIEGKSEPDHASTHHGIDDDRLAGQLRVAAHLLAGGRLRANELFHLRLRNLRCYESPLLVEVEISPMLRDGTLKTPSSKRVLAYSDPDAIKTILDWQARRFSERALSSDYLFGDPHQPKQIYRLGKLYVLLNLLTRATTGSRHASLHTWGHSWASAAVAHAFITPSDGDLEPLDKIATDMGHLSAATTLQHYVHRFEHGLRHHLDLEIREVEMSSRVAERWSGVKATTLRQRVFASKAAAGHTFWEAIAARAGAVKLENSSAGISFSSPSSPIAESLGDEASYELIVLALADIAAGLDQLTVARRCRRSPEWIDGLTRAASQALLLLRDTRLERCRTIDSRFFVLGDALRDYKLSLDFTRSRQEKFRSARTRLKAMTPEETRTAVSAWQSSYTRKYLSLEDPEVAERLFATLATLDVPAQCLALSISTESQNKTARQRESLLQLSFQRAFACNPLVDEKHPRRGRPRDYLLWSSRPLVESRDPPGASVSLAGFNALMFASSVFLILGKE